jgi:transposase
MPFVAVARIVNLSWHRVHAICSRYVELALGSVDGSELTAVAIDKNLVPARPRVSDAGRR